MPPKYLFTAFLKRKSKILEEEKRVGIAHENFNCANIGYFYRYGFLTHFMFQFYSSIDGRITVFNNFVF
jgi:hypothetical protein